MKILITGGAGFIGSNFVCSALAQGHHIINVDKLTYAGNLDNLEDFFTHQNHDFHKQDICDREFLEQIVFKSQPDVIYHMAAESHVDRSIDCADEFIRTNILGTHTLLDVALKYYKSIANKEDFKFIHLSTDEVFGALGKDGKFDESMPYRPNSPYAASKASSDLLVRSYHQTYGMPTITINSSNNYGPKQYAEKLIPLTLLNALEMKPLPVYGKGAQIRDWLYVEDHVNALFSILSLGKIGESYCIGSDNEMTNLDLVNNICEVLDEIRPQPQSHKSLITFVKDRPGHDFRYATDASKLKSHTRWQPCVNFHDGLRQTINWYMAHFERLCTNEVARKRIGVR